MRQLAAIEPLCVCEHTKLMHTPAEGKIGSGRCNAPMCNCFHYVPRGLFARAEKKA